MIRQSRQPEVLKPEVPKLFPARLTAAISLICLIGGCAANHSELEKRSVFELYDDAVKSTKSRPEVIQQASNSPFCDQYVEVEPANCYPTGAIPSQSNPIPSRDQLQPNARPEGLDLELLPLPPIISSSDYVSGEIVQTSAISELSASGEPRTISEIFEQTDIREAIQILAAYVNASVVVDDTVGGVTSAVIQNETFDKALEKILLPLGLVYIQNDGRYLVAPPDPDSPLFSYIAIRTQYLPLNQNVETLTTLLPPRYKQFLQVSTQRNMVVIDAPNSISADIVERLRELDQPIPQVELEAIVCVASPESNFRFGLDWGHAVGVENAQSLKVGLTGLAFSASGSKQGVNNAFSDFAVTSAFVRLLAQEGYVTIRAAPRVTAKDGEKANISINRETFFSLQPSNTNLLFRQDVQKVQAGITLEITPRVHGDMVSVQIDRAEVSEDIRSNGTDLSNNPYPIINRRTVSTQVNVRDGHTIVIGGLVQRQTVDHVNRIPYLSKIPVAGKLFQTIEKQEQEAEVAIFISPRIVPPDHYLMR